MNSLLTLPRWLLAAGLAAITLGTPLGLYALLTVGQRRTRTEIRRAARQNGWEYRRRWWQGNPMAFRIDGHNASGLAWKLTSDNRTYDGPGWTTEMVLRFPGLGGETDIALAPRDDKQPLAQVHEIAVPGKLDERIAGFSRTLSGAVHFLANTTAVVSGSSDFDARYEVHASPEFGNCTVVDAALAEQILHWPANALTVHSIVGWRDPYGFVLQARLPGPPNWATVSHFLEIGDSFVRRLPAPRIPAAPATRLDNLIGRLLR